MHGDPREAERISPLAMRLTFPRFNTPRAVGFLLWGVAFLATSHVLVLGISNRFAYGVVLASLIGQVISPAARAWYERPHGAVQRAHGLLSAVMLVVGCVVARGDPLLATLLGECAVLHAALRVLWLPTPRPAIITTTYPPPTYRLSPEELGSMAVDL